MKEPRPLSPWSPRAEHHFGSELAHSYGWALGIHRDGGVNGPTSEETVKSDVGDRALFAILCAFGALSLAGIAAYILGR